MRAFIKQMMDQKWVKKEIVLFFLIAPICSLAQTGPAGVGTTDGSSALKLWLDASDGVFADTSKIYPTASGGKVKCWKDLSGSNNHVYAQADSNSPTFISSNGVLNNQNGIRFYQNKDSSNRRNYLVSKTFSKTNDITMYCVFHALTKAAGNDITPYKSTGYNPNLWYSGYGLIDGGVGGILNDISLTLCDTSLAAGCGDSTTATDYCVKIPASIHTTYFATLQKQAWTGILSIAHNNSTGASYLAGAQPINNAARYFIGSTSDTSAGKLSPFFDGYIASVLVYNKILSAVEKIIVENYLSAKYGMPLLQNDFYKGDEPSAGNYDFEVIGVGKASDGSSLLTAKGEGVLEASATELEYGDFLLMGHNGAALSSSSDGLPEGIKFKLDRKWACSKTGSASKVDLIIDPKEIPLLENKDVVLLIDTDQNGTFANETLGKGIIPMTELSQFGRVVFRGVELKNGQTFTFGQMKPACQSNCEAYFSPNGDGVTDSYFIDNPGRTSIYDRSGHMVKAMTTPGFWDGTNEKGEPADPGLYFLIANEDSQKTVTLIK